MATKKRGNQWWTLGGRLGRRSLGVIGIIVVLLLVLVFNVDPWSWFRKVVPVVPKEQGVYFVGGDKSLNRRGDIVFIHGLDGDRWNTWGDQNAQFYWPKWLSEQNPDVGVWTVGYDASSSDWTGNPMGIGDRSESILRQMRNQGIGKRPILLICHSLGGIIAKRMIVDSAIRSDEVNVEFINQIKGVAFLATPHSGSDAGTLAKIVKAYRPSELVPRLDKDDDTLRNLNISYRSIVPKRNIGTLPLAEKYDVPVVGRVVTESSADPGMGGDIKAIPVNETHLSICKPKSADNDVVAEVSRFIDKFLLPPPEPIATTLEEFLKDYAAAKQSGDFESLRKVYRRKQFTWDAFVRVSTTQKDTDPESYPVYALCNNQTATIGEEIIGADFPRYSQSFKDLKNGAKIRIRGVFSDRTSSSSVRLKECELLTYQDGDLVR